MSVFRSATELGSSSSPSVVGTNCAILTATLTRPADTTAYEVNDAVSNSTSAPTSIEIVNAARMLGGSFYIVGALLETDQVACGAAMRVHLFTTAIATVNDNAAYTQLWTNRAPTRAVYLDFPAFSTEGSGSTSAISLWTGTPLLCICNAASSSIFPRFVTKTIFTPASAQNFQLTLMVDKN